MNTRRRLFADDATHGVALLGVAEKKFDVVLMNPPFGAGSTRAKKDFDKAYPRTKNDVYAAFVERGVELLASRGRVGAITSRTGFFLSSFQKWREEVLLPRRTARRLRRPWARRARQRYGRDGCLLSGGRRRDGVSSCARRAVDEKPQCSSMPCAARDADDAQGAIFDVARALCAASPAVRSRTGSSDDMRASLSRPSRLL